MNSYEPITRPDIIMLGIPADKKSAMNDPILTSLISMSVTEDHPKYAVHLMPRSMQQTEEDAERFIRKMLEAYETNMPENHFVFYCTNSPIDQVMQEKLERGKHLGITNCALHVWWNGRIMNVYRIDFSDAPFVALTAIEKFIPTAHQPFQYNDYELTEKDILAEAYESM